MNALDPRFLTATFALLLASVGSAAPVLNWSNTVDSGVANADRTRAVAMIGNGDVIAASQVGSGTNAQLQVQRIAAASGTAVWTRVVGTAGFAEDVADLVIDPVTGDAYIAARAATAFSGLDWLVFKVNVSDGTLGWGGSYISGGSGNDEPRAICMTSDGHVAVAGMETNTTSGFGRFRVTKLNASTGAHIWSNVSAADGSDAMDVIGDSNGNVIAVGRSGADAYIAKYPIGGGAPTWSQTYNGDGNGNDIWNAVALLGAGDIAVAGILVESSGAGNFAIVRTPAAGGGVAWKRTVSGTANAADAAFDLTSDGTDVYAAGLLRDATNGQTAYLAKIAGMGGTVTWSTTKNGSSAAANATDAFFSVRLNGANVLAAGTLTNAANKADIVISRYGTAGAFHDDTVFNGPANNQDRFLNKNLLAANGNLAAIGGDSENATPVSDGIVRSYTLITPSDAWRYQYFLTYANSGNAADIADPDHDGLVNQMERAFNLNPNIPGCPILTAGTGTSGLPLIRRTGLPPVFSIQYIRRKASANSGLTYTPQFSSTLGNSGPGGWLPAAGAETVQSIDAEWERVTVQEDVSGQTKRFGRVRVTASP